MPKLASRNDGNIGLVLLLILRGLASWAAAKAS